MMERLAQWAAGEGFSTVRADWIARAPGLGEDIRVRLADRELSGRFEALDPDGNMILRLPDGRAVAITAGDMLYADVYSVGEDAG
jgi:BirA family biotin operon repressor/biotin-[acetyl-CoA-carboxylase] ligase